MRVPAARTATGAAASFSATLSRQLTRPSSRSHSSSADVCSLQSTSIAFHPSVADKEQEGKHEVELLLNCRRVRGGRAAAHATRQREGVGGQASKLKGPSHCGRSLPISVESSTPWPGPRRASPSVPPALQRCSEQLPHRRFHQLYPLRVVHWVLAGGAWICAAADEERRQVLAERLCSIVDGELGER